MEGLERKLKAAMRSTTLNRMAPDLEALVRAFHAAALPGHRLFLVGPLTEPHYAATLRSLIESLGLSKQVHLPGIMVGREKLAALAAADIFVMPSFYESFGNAAAEAVAAGVPVLLTKECGLAPVVDGRAGLAVGTAVAALDGGLRRLHDPSERAKLTARRGEVLQELSWEEPLRQMDELYRSLAKG